MAWWDRFRRRKAAPPAPAPVRVRQFAGAAVNRLTSDWVTQLLGANDDLDRSLRKLRERSRAMTRDTPTGARIRQLHGLHVAGPHGIGLQVALRSTRGLLQTRVNEQIEWSWWTWGQRGACTVDGAFAWRDVLRVASEVLVDDGEFLALHATDAEGRYALRLLDPDQLDLDYTEDARNGNRVVMGVEVTRDGRPVAYHIWDGHPQGKHKGQRRRYTAQDVLHWFIPRRPGQVRGVPVLASTLLPARHLEEFIEAAVVAARVGAAKSVYYTQDSDAPGLATGSDGTELALKEELEPGMARLLPPGVTPVPVDPDYPSGDFGPFESAITRRIAMGAGLAYTSVSGDLEAVNYSSIRAGLLDERDHWRALQQSLIDGVCVPVFRRWLATEYARGALRLPSADLVAVERATTWRPRGWAWVDPLKDVEALKQEIALGIQSRTEAAAERGREFADVVAVLAQEQADAAAAGVPVNGMLPETMTGGMDDDEEADDSDAADDAADDAAGLGERARRQRRGRAA